MPEERAAAGIASAFKSWRGRAASGRFYAALREHLAGDAEGAARISAFEQDPAAGEAALAQYLAERLPGDDALAAKLTSALQGTGDGRFATVATGGHVDQIVNIAKLGMLNLTVRRYLYVFRDLKQLIVTLAALILVLAVTAGIIWKIRQPAVLDGDFNIAIAEFAESPPTSQPIAAAVASEMLFNTLTDEYRGGRFGDVQVGHARMPVVSDAGEAERLAAKVHADMVVYGSVTRIGDDVRIWPRIWVAPEQERDVSVISGQHQLGVPSEFHLEELQDPGAVEASGLRRRMIVLVEFTKALSYYTANEFALAQRAADQALDSADAYGTFEGKETLYLLAHIIASEMHDPEEAELFADKALEINPDYGRAYIAKGNIYYGRMDFENAAYYYETALALADEPYGAYVAEKAHVSLANIATYQFQLPDSDPALAEEALAHFAAVIESYRQLKEKPMRVLAAQAYYGSGIVYQWQQAWAHARDAFEETLRLTDAPDLRTRHDVEDIRTRTERRLAEVMDAQ
jgi:tetratricopeptide (TPR) repeat protein